MRVHRVSPTPREFCTSSEPMARRASTEFSSDGDEERHGPGDHWVTIDGHHVLIHEAQGKQCEQTPQSLTAQIPCHIKAAIEASIKASNSPTDDDKKGGFHEEGGQWILTPDGKTFPLPAKAGPANPAIDGRPHMDPADAIDSSAKSGKFDLGGTWHVHPSGTRTEENGNKRVTHFFKQPPSETDIKAAGSGINIVIGAGNKRVYFYDSSGVIGRPMKLKNFLKGC